ncbi:hypothetical protein D3C76_900240 [compost metagenome]
MYMRRLLPGLVLYVLRQNEYRYTILCDRDTYTAVNQVSQLSWRGCLLNEARHIGENTVEVQLLLIIRAACGDFCLTSNSQHRGMIHSCIIQPRQKMRGTGSPG